MKFHKKWKQFSNPLDYQTFCLLRARETRLEKECYTNFIKKSECNITINPKYLWSFIKSKKEVNCIPAEMTYLNKSSRDPVEICSMFNSYFNSVFVPSQNDISLPHTNDMLDTHINLQSLQFSREQVRNLLKNVNVTTGAGPDGVHPIFIRNCADSLKYPMTLLFNLSLSQGVFPYKWKQAIITPIQKIKSLIQ